MSKELELLELIGSVYCQKGCDLAPIRTNYKVEYNQLKQHIISQKELVKLQKQLLTAESRRIRQMMYNRAYLIGDEEIQKLKRYRSSSKRIKDKIEQILLEVN